MRKTLTQEEWFTLGEKLYGPDKKKWKFRCPACGHVQSFESILETTPAADKESIAASVFYECEGRINPEVGCDWDLAGVIKIHGLVVTFEGKKIPSFLFADDPDTVVSPHYKPRETGLQPQAPWRG